MLRPLIESLGYRIARAGDPVDILIALEDQEVPQDANVVRLRAAVEGQGSVYRYDRAALIGALAAAKGAQNMAELLLIARLAGRRIAFPAADVEAVVELEGLTPAPRAAPHVAGLSALRSRVLTVIDGLAALEAGRSEGPARDAIVVPSGGHTYALLVDEVEDVIEASTAPVPAKVATGHRLGSGLAWHDRGRRGAVPARRSASAYRRAGGEGRIATIPALNLCLLLAARVFLLGRFAARSWGKTCAVA